MKSKTSPRVGQFWLDSKGNRWRIEKINPPRISAGRRVESTVDLLHDPEGKKIKGSTRMRISTLLAEMDYDGGESPE